MADPGTVSHGVLFKALTSTEYGPDRKQEPGDQAQAE